MTSARGLGAPLRGSVTVVWVIVRSGLRWPFSGRLCPVALQARNPVTVRARGRQCGMLEGTQANNC